MQKDIENSWSIENEFHKYVRAERWTKYIAQYETVRRCSASVSGAVVEVGVHKMNSLVRLHAFHKALGLDPQYVGFDMFDTFMVSNPESALDSDFSFVQNFEEKTGGALSLEEAQKVADYHCISNIKLLKGDIFETIPENIDLFSSGIRFLHVDVDVLPATYFALQTLVPLSFPDTIYQYLPIQKHNIFLQFQEELMVDMQDVQTH